MPVYTITPQDVLMFRDGRPMEGGLSGHGARWPEPSVIFDALHAALHRAFPAERKEEFQAWEHSHRYGRSSDRDMNRDRTQRFGSLATAGPFPALGGEWFFPCPQDVTVEDRLEPTLYPLKENAWRNDLPNPLVYPLASRAEPTKAQPKPWWNKAAIEACLAGKAEALAARLRDNDDFFGSEWVTGIAIDPETLTTGRGEAEGKIYSAEYLRLRDGVILGIHATMPMKNGDPGARLERLNQLFPAQKTIIVGGQQRACQVEEAKADGKPVPLDQLLPVSPPIAGRRVKWLLLSPAVYPAIRADAAKGISAHSGGWLPNWIAPSDDYAVRQGDREVRVEKGRVLLKLPIPRNNLSRDEWRKRVREAPFLNCRLVAARIPKPIVLTGWTEALHLKDTPIAREHGPRPTLLAVPAGAVYYFEGPDAPRLAEVLSWHGATPDPTDPSAPSAPPTIRNRRSTLLGEKGYGLGVCGAWQFFPGSD